MNVTTRGVWEAWTHPEEACPESSCILWFRKSFWEQLSYRKAHL